MLAYINEIMRETNQSRLPANAIWKDIVGYWYGH